MPVRDYNTDPNLNTSISGINIAEGCAPANINNAIRQEMADTATEFAATSTVASAATIDLGAQNGSVSITGTTAITSFGTSAAGLFRRVTFTGSLTLTHNATSLILPGGANIITAAGDAMLIESLGSGNWRVLNYTRAANDPSLVIYDSPIINGNMDIWQRGTSFAVAGGTTGAYTADRFWFNSQVGVTVTRSTDAPTGLTYSVDIPTGGGNFMNLGQRIEAINAIKYIGRTVTFRVWLRRVSGTANTLTLSLYYPSVADNFSTINLISTQTIAASLGTTWTLCEATFTNLPANISTGLAVLIGSTNSNATNWRATGLEMVGFKNRNIGLELDLCRRYYHQLPIYVSTAASGIVTNIQFVMRTAPTITGGGAGFATQPGTASANGVGVFQTTGAVQTLVFNSEL